MSKIVVGLGYGDEGKGLTTSFLCSQTKNPIVVRFNGGHQAGHTVIENNQRHVFSSFGSGTLQGVPTYWSEYCTFEPRAFLNEYRVLNNTCNPIIFVDPLCPVTTPFDKERNQMLESREVKMSKKQLVHGSVGVGFGTTIQRQEDHYKLFVQDLLYPSVLKAKLENIRNNYYTSLLDEDIIEKFLADVEVVKDLITIVDRRLLSHYNPVFEGAQGILLDMDFGFFPNVTRSNTTTKNAFNYVAPSNTDVYYAIRSYATRHGKGFFSREQDLILRNNENETNKTNTFQGEFRTGVLDIEMIDYALQCDRNFSKGANRKLVITCMDQFDLDVDKLLDKLDFVFSEVYLSFGPSKENIILYKKNY